MKLKIILLVTVSAIIFYLLESNNDEQASIDLSNNPQFVITKFSQINTDKQGKYSSMILGDKLHSFGGQKNTEITNPIVILKKTQPVTMSAKLGILKADILSLSNDVVVTQTSSQLITNSLEIELETSIATTFDDIQLYDVNSKTSATGARIDSNNNLITLFSNVKTIYHPPK